MIQNMDSGNFSFLLTEQVAGELEKTSHKDAVT